MKYLLSFFIFFISSQASATTYVKQDISHYFTNAEIVATVLIKKGELLEGEFEDKKVNCGQSAFGEIIESFKGSKENVSFFITGMRLNIGETYMVYLNKTQNKTKIKSTNSISQSRQYIQERACSKHYRGLRANWLNTSGFVSTYSNSKQKREYWIMPAYNIKLAEDADIEFKKIELRALNIDGDVVTKDFWSGGDDTPLPYIFWMYKGAYKWESYKKYFLSITSR